jgi:hypothetical protein
LIPCQIGFGAPIQTTNSELGEIFEMKFVKNITAVRFNSREKSYLGGKGAVLGKKWLF